MEALCSRNHSVSTDCKTVPMQQRQFQRATLDDTATFESAAAAFLERKRPDGSLSWIPARPIPREARADDRLLQYGYTRYSDLFNVRQLLHLSFLAQEISGLQDPIREAMALAFSDHLTTNCMMTHYAFGWRRLAPLFSIRAFRHVSRPVEINPWLDGTGRGTFPNAVRQVQRAINWARAHKYAHNGEVMCPSQSSRPEHPESPSVSILQRDSRNLEFLDDSTIDLVLTDPPYFDNIAYSELSDFYVPWLQQFGLIPPDGEMPYGSKQNLAAKARDGAAASKFQSSLRECFCEICRVLRPNGRLVFTYQHQTADGWHALASALIGTGLQPVQLFPMLGDSTSSLHKHRGSIGWDAVFVFVKSDSHEMLTPVLSDTALLSAQLHFKEWACRLINSKTCNFGPADQRNFYRACLVAGALGLFPTSHQGDASTPLTSLLSTEPPTVKRKEPQPDATTI
jgi:adenine-specific DNA methylase